MKFTLRELMLLVLSIALALGWWVDATTNYQKRAPVTAGERK